MSLGDKLNVSKLSKRQAQELGLCPGNQHICLDHLNSLSVDNELNKNGWLLQGPQVFTVPTFDTPRRYFIVQLSDAYQNFFAALGSSFNSSGKYLVAGRGEVLMLQFPHFQKLLRLF